MTKVGDLKIGLGFDFTEADRQLDEYGRKQRQRSTTKLQIDPSDALKATDEVIKKQREAAAEDRRLSQEGQQRLRDRAATIRLNAQLAAQASRDEQAAVRASLTVQREAERQRRTEQQAANQAYRDGMARLREANAQAQLNSRLAAQDAARRRTEQQADAAAQREGQQRLRDANAQAQLNARLERERRTVANAAAREAVLQERQKQQAIKAVVDSLANETASVRALWQAGRIAAPDLVTMQRDIQARALAATQGLDAQTAAYRRLAQVAAQAQRAQDQATGRVTPGSLGASFVTGIQQSGLFQQIAASGALGGAAQNLGIVAQGFMSVRSSALVAGTATNTAATAMGFATAAGAGLVIGLAALAGGFVSLAKVGMDETFKLQRGLNTLQANGTADLEGFTGNVKALRTELGVVGKSFSTADLTIAAADLVKANLSAADSLTVLRSSTKLASAENINLQQSSAQILMNLRQYGLGVDQAARVTDMFAKGGNLAAGTANDLSVGFGIVGTTGMQAKIEMHDLMGMLIELDNKGMSAADVGANGLRTAISSLSDITEKGKGVLHELGVEIVDAQGKARPAGDIMADLGVKMRGMGITVNKSTGELSGNGEALKTVATIMDTRAAAAVLALTGEWRTFGAEVKDSAGYADEYSRIMAQGPERALQRLKTEFAETGLALTKNFAGPLADFLDQGVTPLVEKLGNVFDKLTKLKSLGEVALQLKITGEDDATTSLLKLLGGGIAGTIHIVTSAGTALQDTANRNQEGFNDLVRKWNLAQLQGELVRNGILKREYLPGPQLAQARDIEANRGHYEALLAAALSKNTDALLQSVGLGKTSGTNVLPAGMQGPLAPGQTRSAATAWNAQFIGSLKDVFVSDPKVDSDCAIIASRILRALGVQIEEEANAGALAKAVKKIGKQVTLADAQPGDYIDFAGPGFGRVSGHHSGVVVGRDKNGNLQYINNHGYGSRPGVDVPTTIDTYDAAYIAKRGTATFYRPDASPYAQGGNTAAGGKPAPTPANPNELLKKTIAEGKSLIAQYRLALASGNEVWQAKAGAALDYFRKKHKEVAGALKDDYASLNRDVESRERAAAQRRASTRASLEGQLDKQLAAGKLDQAQATAGKMQQQLDTELAKYRNNAAGRLRVEQDLGPRVLAAQKRVLEAQRDQAVAAAEETARQQRTKLTATYGKGKEPADLLANIARGEQSAINTANSTFSTKLSALYSASTERINSATAAVQAKSQQVAQQRLATEQQVAQQLAGLNQQQRQAVVQGAQDELTSLQRARQRRLDGAKGNAAQILQIERDTAAGIQAAQEKLALTQLAAAKRLAEEQKAAAIAAIPKGASAADRLRITQEAETVRLGAVSSAYRAYSLAVTQAQDTAVGSVQDASRKQGEALDGLKGKYQDLIAGFSKQLLSDNLSDEDVTAFWADLNGLLKDAKASGMDLDPVIAGLRDRARELANSAPGVRAWSEEFAKAQQIAGSKYGDADLNAQYAMRGSYGVGEEGYKNALNGYGVLSVDELEGINPTAAKAMRSVYKEVLDQMLADQEKAAQESLNILDYYTAEAERLGDEVATGADQSADEKASRDSARVKALAGGGPGRMLEFLGGYGNEFFGDQFFTKLGTEGRAQFLEAFGKFDEEALATLGQDTLSGVLGQIGDAPEWATLRAQLDAAYARAAQMRQDVDATLGDIYNNPDGYGDGGRGQTSKVPTSRFDELRGAIFGQAEALRSGTDDGIGDWLAGELDKAREAGQLTVNQLNLLKATLAEIRAGGALEIAPTADEKRLSSWDDRLSALIDDLNAGAISQDEFNAQALEGVVTLGRLADAAERNEKPELADQWRQMAQALGSLIQPGENLADALGNSKPLSLSEWQEQLQILTDDFDSGVSTADEYAAGLQQLGADLGDMARKADAAGNPKLAQAFRDQAAALRAMNPEIAGALQTLGKVQDYAGYVRDVAGAFGQLAGAIGEGEQEYDRFTGAKLQTPWKDLAANLEGVQNAAGKVVEIVGDVMRIVANPADIGAWVSLVTKVVSSIADAIAGFQKAQAEVRRLKEDFAQDNPFLNAGDYQKAFTRSRGWFADTFGGGPEVVNEIDKVGLKFAQTMQNAFQTGIKNGLSEAIQKNDFSLFSKALHQEVYSGLLEGVIDVFLNETLLKNIIAPAIKAWSDALKTPGTADDAEALAGIDAAVGMVDQQAARFYSDVAPRLQGLQDKWGLTPEDTKGVDTTGLSTAPPAIQYALSTPLLDVGRDLKDAGGMFLEGVKLFRDTVQGGIPVTVSTPTAPYRSTTAALPR